MADGSQPEETDILRLLEQVYGGDPAALRERGLSQAVSALEDTHRRAALAMRRLETQGVPAPASGAASAQKGAEAADESAQAAPAGAAAPVQVQSGDGAQVDMGHRTLTHIVRPRGK